MAGIGELANATPYGAAFNLANSAISTPNTSRSGDISSGLKLFKQGDIGGVSFGTQVPSWLWYVGAALGAYILWKKFRK